MYQYGLKLWSINNNYLQEAVRLYSAGIYDYIELFVVPGSYNDFSTLWSHLPMPFIIHAPHFDMGMNLADRTVRDKNLYLAQETIRFADKLHAETIIFHPGVAGDINETVHQLHDIHDERIVIENKPYYGHNDVLCNGCSPDEIKYITENVKIGFCLDIGHAVCYANAINLDPVACLSKFIELKPKMYHLTDGSYNAIYDCHKHICKGDYNFFEILPLLPDDCTVTIETDKDSSTTLDDFAEDISSLKNIIAKLKSEK